MQPLRTIRVTAGKTAAYAAAKQIRDRGGQVSTVNVRGRTYEVRVYREPLPVDRLRGHLASLLDLRSKATAGTLTHSRLTSDITAARDQIKAWETT